MYTNFLFADIALGGHMDWKSAATKDDGTSIIPTRWLLIHYYEALNILFRTENALRVFAYVILKNEFKEKWPDTELQLDEQTKSTISAAASKRISQSKGFGYLGYEINSPLMYLNSGELTRIIDAKAYWPIFEPFFRGKKEIIRNKLDEIAAIRNALAHFRPLKPDDIEVIKQNVKHVFLGIEQCLTEMTQTHRTVPTNTEHAWYKELSTLGSSLCDVRLFQNNAGTWIRLQIEYTCAMLQNSGPGDFRSFTVSNLISPAILKAFPGLARHCIFATEIVPHSEVTRDTAPAFKKIISATLSRATINNHHAEINASMKEILLKIESETELVQKDNLAKGTLIDPTFIYSLPRERSENNKVLWTNFDALKCGISESDPPEYWGDFPTYITDFIAGAQQYPWMPSEISKAEFPF